MIYLGYSELTKRFYVLPTSTKQPKTDITEDIHEIIESFAAWLAENKYRYLISPEKRTSKKDDLLKSGQLFDEFLKTKNS